MAALRWELPHNHGWPVRAFSALVSLKMGNSTRKRSIQSCLHMQSLSSYSFVKDFVFKKHIVPDPRRVQWASFRRCQVAPRLGRQATSSFLAPFQEPRPIHPTHWLVVKDSQTSQWVFSR